MSYNKHSSLRDLIKMTAENRKRLAEHYFLIGKSDHPYCKEFPQETKVEEKTKSKGKK